MNNNRLVTSGIGEIQAKYPRDAGKSWWGKIGTLWRCGYAGRPHPQAGVFLPYGVKCKTDKGGDIVIGIPPN